MNQILGTSLVRWLGIVFLLASMILPYGQGITAPVLEPAKQSIPTLELHEGLVGQISKLNPLFAASNPVDQIITTLIYEGLTTINQYGEVVPALAENWVVSADGLDYIFRLRQDVLWQDGIPFTAADVAYTIRTIRSPDFPGDPALNEFWRTIEVEILDDYTIRFRLVQPLASFPERLRQGIVPVHALEGAPVARLAEHPFNLSPIGTGAYQIETLFAENGSISGISLRVAPNFRARAEGQNGYAIDRVVFRTYPTWDAKISAYQNGEINSLGHVPHAYLETVRALPNIALHNTNAPAIGVLIFNWQRQDVSYLREQRFRLALAHAADQTTAVTNALTGRAIPAQSPIVPNSWAYNPNAVYPTQNFDQARRFLESVSFDPREFPVEAEEDDENAEEGSEESEEPETITVEQRRNFTILVPEDPGIAGVAFELTFQWEQIGLAVELDMVDYPTYFERLRSGDFDTAIVEFDFTPKADPDQFVLWHSGQYQIGQNYGGMDDSFISNVLVQARLDPVNSHRKIYYDRFQEAFANRAPAIVLYYPLFVYATTPRLEGVQLDFISQPSDRFRTIQNWTFAPIDAAAN